MLRFLFAFVPALPFLLPAQTLNIVNFPVEGYDINKVGYPSKIIPGDRPELMYYVEYWAKGQVRREDGYYLQGMTWKREKGEEFVDEAWAEPLSPVGTTPMAYTGLHALQGGMAVVGRQLNGKTEVSAASFFDFGGRRIGPVATVTPFKSKLKDYRDDYVTSPGGEKLLWMGYDPAEDPQKRTHYLALFNHDGRPGGRMEPYLPSLKKGYDIVEMLVDKRGNGYLLLMPTAGADSTQPPVLAQLDLQNRKTTETPLEFKGKQVAFVKLHITQNDQLVVLAATGDKAGFTNGEKRLEGKRKVNQVEFIRYNLMRNFLKEASTATAVPDSVLKRYATEGANFAPGRVVEDGDRLFWIWEEQYSQNKVGGEQFFYEDLGIWAMEKSQGELKWQAFIEKEQSDLNSANLLGYVPGTTGLFLHLVYLTKKGAGGEVVIRSVNKETGGVLDKTLMSNESGDFLFFPGRSVYLGDRFVLMGVGHTNRNDYFLINVTQLP